MVEGERTIEVGRALPLCTPTSTALVMSSIFQLSVHPPDSSIEQPTDLLRCRFQLEPHAQSVLPEAPQARGPRPLTPRAGCPAFKPKQAPSGTKQYQLKKFAESTLVRVVPCVSRPSCGPRARVRMR